LNPSGEATDPDRAAPGPEPHAVYAAASASHQGAVARWKRRERWLSHLRLAVFALGALIGWLAFGSRQIDPVWLAPPVVAFVALLVAHDRVISHRRLAERTLDFYARGLARLEDRWTGTGNQDTVHQPPDHPYADDLDVFGPGSFFELLCTARTAAGEAMLADWLLEPVPGPEARARQSAVRELAPRVALRLDLSLLGEDVGRRVGAQALITWGSAPPILAGGRLHWIGGGLTTLTLAGLAGWLFGSVGAIPFLAALSLQGAFALRLRPRVRAVIAGVESPSHDLVVLSGLLARIEREDFASERLVTLRRVLESRGETPSRRIAELRRLVDLLDARRNQFFAPIGALLCWSTQIALALERWRADCGDALGPWIETAAEIEVLCALSGYAYEHPADVFAEIVDEGPVFEATELGHPLIAQAKCVRNDLSLGGELRALMMSGSNMSGKSTMLRTVGAACMLTLAGLPVRAQGLRLSSLQVAASIRISDSLQQGASHFFAEIKRLRLVVDLTDGPRPVLFLLDEVLHGTNSHDRRIGAEAVVKGLIERGAIGIVTTHDLALARIADDLAPTIRNVHFEDQLEDGEMRFDYLLRSGVVTRSNAIELMRSVGLEV
jgi:hypothetical protein